MDTFTLTLITMGAFALWSMATERKADRKEIARLSKLIQ